MNRNFWVLIIAIIWTTIILGFIGMKEYTLRTGREIVLATVPVDPRDLFRGDYVVLRYEASTLKTSLLPLYEGGDSYYSWNNKQSMFKEGENIWVVFEKIEDKEAQVSYHRPKGIYKNKKPDKTELYMKGEVVRVYAGGETIEVKYGIEQYFVPEGKGRDIENQTGHTLLVKASVNQNGSAVIKDLIRAKRLSLEEDFENDEMIFEDSFSGE